MITSATGFKGWILSELTFAEHHLQKGKAKCIDEKFESVSVYKRVSLSLDSAPSTP